MPTPLKPFEHFQGYCFCPKNAPATAHAQNPHDLLNPPLESKMPAKRKKYSLTKVAGEIGCAETAWIDTREEKPLKMIALHVFDVKAGSFKDSFDAPPQKKVLHRLGA